jgi:tRNA nucleotidyltransferase/poly(A) polymerase
MPATRTSRREKSREAARIARALRRRPDLACLARLLSPRGAKAWIVGGAIRDRLLGRREGDLDVVVAADPEGPARGLEALGFGRAVAISDRAPRVFRVAGRGDLDLAELERGSIEGDLARRDFTANAIALDLADGRWIDPYGGVEDVRRRRLRLVSAANLREDPLRGFRAARLYATHGLRPDPATLREVRAIAPRVAEAAAERASAELAKLLEADRVAPALAWAARAKVLAPALGLSPSPRGWGRALALSRRLERPLRGTPPESRRRVRLAAIAIGAGLDGPGAARWVASRRFGRSEAAAVRRLVDLAAEAPGSGSKERWRWICEAGALAREAALLMGAAEPRSRPGAAALRRLARKPRRGPRVGGREVMAWLRIPEGPRVGRLLRELEVEIRRGAVRSRPEARRWLENAVRNS